MTTSPNGSLRWVAWATGIAAAVGIIAFVSTTLLQLGNQGHDATDALALGQRNLDRINRMDTAIAKLTSDLEATRQALIEIETQFCGEDAKIALMHSYDLRFESMLWEKTYGQPIPIANAVYPPVDRCQQASQQ